MKMNCLIVGVGGQGTLLAGKILGEYARLNGLDCKVSEVHGMAQRGGCVVTHVKMDEKVYSPLVEAGEAQALLAFEPAEALRWKHMLKQGGTLIASSDIIAPLSVTLGNAQYPTDYERRAKQGLENVRFIKARELAEKSGTARAANVVLLGVYTAMMQLDQELMKQAIRASVKPAFVTANELAFSLGLQAARSLI